MIDIRISGHANMANVRRELAQTTKAFAAFRAAAQNSSSELLRQGDYDLAAKNYRKWSNQATSLGRSMDDVIRAQGDFNVAQMKVADQSDKLVDRIQKQKLGVRGLAREWKQAKQLFQEQYDLQHSTFRVDGVTPGGNLTGSLIIPKNLEIAGTAMDKFRMKLGHMRNLMDSVNTQLINFGKNTQWSGRQLMAGLTYPLAIAAGVSAKYAYDIDKGLTHIVKVYGDTGDAVRESDESIKESAMSTVRYLSKTYGQAAKDTLEIQSQLASTGKTGAELQNATQEVSRAMLLGDLNIQDAMDATISLQEVYGMGADKLAESFNYMNMMENQTSLTMQDFVEGIPKVSGIMKVLDGSLQDTGVLLAGFKAAGIDAKEGGTALKSMVFKDVAPSTTAIQRFGELTGASLEAIVDSTKGKPIETLQGIAEAIDHLDPAGKIKVMSAVFGIHQGSKAAGLIQMLKDITTEGTQMNKAFDISKNQGPGEWAETAAQELAKLKAADWVRIKSAIETLKNGMADFGREILVAAAPALEKLGNFVSSLGEAFSGLGEGTKKFIIYALGAVAAIGPLVMMTGLFLNLAGQISNFVKNVMGPLAINRELMTKKQMAEKLATDAQTEAVLRQASAYRFLNDAMAGQTSKSYSAMLQSQALMEQRASSGMGMGTGVPVGASWAPLGKADNRSGTKGTSDWGSAYSAAGPDKKAGLNAFANKNAVNAAKSIAEDTSAAALNSKRASISWGAIANHAQALSIGVGAMGMMAGHSNSMLNNISTAVMAAGLLGPSLARGLAKVKASDKFANIMSGVSGIGSKASGWIKADIAKSATMTKTVNKASQGAKAAGAAFKTLGASIAGMAGPIGIAALAIGGLFYLINKKQREAVAAQEAVNNSYSTFAKLVGATLVDEKEFEAGGENTGSQYKKLAEEALAADENLKKGYEDVRKSLEGMDNDQKKVAIRAYAIQKGMEARVRGATAEHATEIARIAATAIDASFADEWPIKIKATAFVDVESINQGQINDVGRKIEDVFRDGMKGLTLIEYGGFDLSNESKNSIDTAVKNAWAVYSQASEEEAQGVYQTMAEGAYRGMNEAYGELSSEQKAILEKHGVADGRTLAKYVARVGPAGLRKELEKSGANLGPEQFAYLEAGLLTLQRVMTQYGEEIKLDPERAKEIAESYNMDALLGESPFTTKGVQKMRASSAEAQLVQKEYTAELKRRTDAGEKLTDAEKIQIATNYTMRLGWGEATNASDDLSKAVSRSTDKIKEHTRAKRDNSNVIPDMTGAMTGVDDFDIPSGMESRALDAQKEVMTSIQDEIFTMFEDSMQASHDGRIEAYEREGEAAVKSLERDAKSKEAAFDRRSRALESSFEKRERLFESRWEKNKDKFESSWDKTMERFEKSSERAREAVERQYDSRIERIDKSIEAERKAEDVRQAIFEKEKARITHLADMANRAIDINMSINSGDLDQAARLFNDAQAAADLFEVDDAGNISKSASEKKIEQLEKNKTVEEKAKDRALKALSQRQEAEKKDLEHRKKMAERAFNIEKDKQKRILDNQKETAKRALENEKKRYNETNETAKASINATTKAKVDSENKKFEAAKRSLALELKALREWAPQNKHQMKQQVAAIEKVYGEYGVGLKTKGGQWSKIIENGLVRHTKAARSRMQNEISWAAMGDKIADQMLDGAFGMSFNQFMKWADDPNATFADLGTAKTRSAKNRKVRDAIKRGAAPGVAKAAFMHTGGVIGQDPGGRVGYSGKISQAEVPIVALKGESILNRNATSRIGRDGVKALNSGGTVENHWSAPNSEIQRGDGPGMSGMAGVMAAGIMSAFIKKAIQQKMQQQQEQAALSGSMMGPVTGQFDAFYKALAKQESGGNYRAVNSLTGALGKYQVLPSNVAPWARQYLGKSMTSSQFLNSPDLQEQLVRAVLGSYYDKWGPRGAAAAWYAGPANHNLHMSTRAQPGGPSIKGYVDSIVGMMNQMLASSMPGASGKGVYPGMGWQKQWDIVRSRFPDAVLTSSKRNGSGASYHNSGRAVDVAYAMTQQGIAKMNTVFEWLRSNFGSKSSELIWSPANNRQIKNGQNMMYGDYVRSIHWNHVHWAMKNGGLVPGVGSGDKTRILGEPGEFMVRKKAVDNIGIDALRLLNSDRFINMPSPALTASGVSGPVAPSVDKSYNPQYNIEIDARGVENPDAIGDAVRKVIRDIDKKHGYKRRIGNDS